jgi:hypothetical protein
MSELVDRATTDIAAGVTSRRFSAVDVADTFLVRIVRYDSAVKAICTRDPEARDTAAVWTDASPAEGRTLDARTGGLEICPRRGTEGSNPSPSRRESIANLTPADAERPGAQSRSDHQRPLR